MKKLYALLFFFINLNLLFSENYFEINSKKLSLDTSIIELQNLFGVQDELLVIPFEPNSDWDTICYKYETFTVYTSRVTKLPYKLEVFGNDFILNIDTIKIHKNFRKQEIEALLRKQEIEALLEKKLPFDYKDKNNNLIYILYLPDFIEVNFIFDENEILQRLFLQYTPMD